jgi:hypothetical protein
MLQRAHPAYALHGNWGSPEVDVHAACYYQLSLQRRCLRSVLVRTQLGKAEHWI